MLFATGIPPLRKRVHAYYLVVLDQSNTQVVMGIERDWMFRVERISKSLHIKDNLQQL